KHTLAHVTHEAVEKIGGIGTVLEGLITSPVYQEHVKRSILVGPCSAHLEVDPAKRLGPHGTVLYSGVDGIDELGLASKLNPIEWAFNVKIIYGKRTYEIPGDVRTGEADVLLIDVFNTNPDRLGVFKGRLWQTFGIDSMRHQHKWDYEEYVRLAEPAFYALVALLNEDELPCILFSHEFMGLATAFKAILDGQHSFRTLFHAHECATARHIVERHEGHDTMFYNVLHEAQKQKLYVEDVFGDLDEHFRHMLISQAHACDGIIAVGDDTAREMHFLGDHFDHHHINLVYNGVPAVKVDAAAKKRARKMLLDYSEKLLGHRPDVLMSHVMRPVISKALWRDLQVCHSLDQTFAKDGRTAVLYILTSAGGTRGPRDIRAMEDEYDWPRQHRAGYPDLVGPEVDYNRMAEQFNAAHANVQIVLVNQFGWSRETIGNRLPEEMHIGDFRIAADVEFGMACYEPFGISPLEPLCGGAICVISNVCGCAGFVNDVTNHKPPANVIIADYTQLKRPYGMSELLAMGPAQRGAVEQEVSAEVARKLLKALPKTDTQRTKLVNVGQKLALDMGWDRVVSDKLLPMLNRLVESDRAGG
ncbi:MAG: hypothetical protein WD079_07180, partial [Phycisphaeraceae bacterium]